MTIETDKSFVGFVASDPQLSYTGKGDARLYMKVGKRHHRKEPNGSYTKLEPTYHNLVAFREAAEHGSEMLRRGDRFLASGYVREYTYQDANGQNVEGEEFVARAFGHNMGSTRYEVDRTPRRAPVEQEAAQRDASAFDAPTRSQAASAPAMGM